MAISLFCLGQVPFAYGFAYRNPTQSTVGLAKGNAVLTDLNEPSSVYYNPAATAFSSGIQFTAGSQFLTYQTDHEFKPIGVDETSVRQNVFIPNFYATANLKGVGLEPVTLGFGVASPFGLKEHWRNQSPIAPVVERVELETYDFLITGALKVNDQLSLGAGMDIIYSNASFKNVIDFGALVGAPRAFDGKAEFDGDDTTVGLNASLLFKPTKKDSFAFVFRSQQVAELDGTVKLRHIPAFTGLPSTLRGDATAKLTYPAIFDFAFAHQFDKLKLEFVLDWTRWENERTLKIDSTSNPFILDLTYPADFRNRITTDLGATYALTKCLDLYGGFIYTFTPIPEKTFNAIVPDADRFGLSCGVGMKLNPSLKVDLGFQWVHFTDREINNSVGFPITTVNGDYNTEVFIVGTNVTYKF